MSKYRLELSRSSKKFLEKSDQNTRERIINVSTHYPKIHLYVSNLCMVTHNVKIKTYHSLRQILK